MRIKKMKNDNDINGALNQITSESNIILLLFSYISSNVTFKFDFEHC